MQNDVKIIQNMPSATGSRDLQAHFHDTCQECRNNSPWYDWCEQDYEEKIELQVLYKVQGGLSETRLMTSLQAQKQAQRANTFIHILMGKTKLIETQ